MKNLLFVIVLLFASCQEAKFDYLIPEGTPYLEDIQKEYTEKLVSKENGWYLNYVVDGVQFNFVIKFKDNGRCDILSDVDGYHYNHTNVKYQIKGLVVPELQFTTYSAFSKIFEFFDGGFEFNITKDGDDSFKLVPVKGARLNLSFQPASVENVTLIEESHSVIDKFRDFTENAPAYFMNLRINSTDSYIVVNLGARTVTFSWLGNNNVIVNETRKFNYLPNNGLKLSSAVTIAGKTLSTLYLGTHTLSEMPVYDENMNFINNIVTEHVPVIEFPYASTAFRYEGFYANLYMYTGDDFNIYASPALFPIWTSIRDEISPSMFRITMNTNTGGDPNTGNVTFLTKPNGSSTVYMRFNLSLTKGNRADHLILTFTGNNSANADPYKAKIVSFMNTIFPPEGVTIMPAGRYTSGEQLFRVISRKDSRINFIMRVSSDVTFPWSWD